MEKARMRRFNFAELQDYEIGSNRAADETELHIHFHPDLGGVANQSFFARQRAD